MPCGREYTACHVLQGVYSVRSNLRPLHSRFINNIFSAHHLYKFLDVNEKMHATLTCWSFHANYWYNILRSRNYFKSNEDVCLFLTGFPTEKARAAGKVLKMYAFSYLRPAQRKTFWRCMLSPYRIHHFLAKRPAQREKFWRCMPFPYSINHFLPVRPAQLEIFWRCIFPYTISFFLSKRPALREKF